MTCHSGTVCGVLKCMTTTDDPGPPKTAASPERQLLARLFAAVENGDVDAYLQETYHPEVTIHESPVLPYGGDYHGLAGVLRHAVCFTATWGPYRSATEQDLGADICAVPGHGYVRWVLTLSGRRFPFISHYRFNEGLIVESTMYPFDPTALLLWWQELRSKAFGTAPAQSPK